MKKNLSVIKKLKEDLIHLKENQQMNLNIDK